MSATASTNLKLCFIMQEDGAEEEFTVNMNDEDFSQLCMKFMTNDLGWVRAGGFSMSNEHVLIDHEWRHMRIIDVCYSHSWYGPLRDSKKFFKGLGITEEKLSDKMDYGDMARIFKCFLEVTEDCYDTQHASRAIYDYNGKMILADDEHYPFGPEDENEDYSDLGTIDKRSLNDIIKDRMTGKGWMKTYGLESQDSK